MSDRTKPEGRNGDGCHPVKDVITNVVHDTGDVLKKTAESVSDGISSVARETGKAGVAIGKAVADAARTTAREVTRAVHDERRFRSLRTYGEPEEPARKPLKT